MTKLITVLICMFLTNCASKYHKIEQSPEELAMNTALADCHTRAGHGIRGSGRVMKECMASYGFGK